MSETTKAKSRGISLNDKEHRDLITLSKDILGSKSPSALIRYWINAEKKKIYNK